MTHIVSDKVIATGVSIKDVLNVQIINNYSEKIEEDPNSINYFCADEPAKRKIKRLN